MTTLTWLTQGSGLVDKDDMHRFMQDCLHTAGAPEENAELLADVLITADYRGNISQGLNHLEKDVKQIMTLQCDPDSSPHIVHESSSTALVEGSNALGPVVGKFCMRLAIDKAKETGVAWVSARGSNDLILLSYYTMQAYEEGLIGFNCSTSTPALPPPGSIKAFTGCNPLSFAAPALYKDGVVLDMSCATVSLGKVELYRRTQQRLLKGWALDETGVPTTDPYAALYANRLLPVGSMTPKREYKGFSLAMAIDTLSGVLAGGKSGPQVVDMRREQEPPVSFSHSFMALDPKRFAGDYEHRLFDVLYRMRGREPVDPDKKIKVPGDIERDHMKKADLNGGISYPTNVLKNALALGHFLRVEPFSIF